MRLFFVLISMKPKHPESIFPPDDLFCKITARIEREERILSLKRGILFSFGIVLPLATFFPVLRALVADIYGSGLAQYFSLVFSDTGAVVAYGGDYISSILESLPVFGIIKFLVIILVFLGSLRITARNLSEFYPGARRFLNN